MKRGFVPLFGLAMTLAALIAAGLLYSRLPDATPVNWGIDGRAHRFLHKPFGPFFYPLILAGITLILSAAPHISPANFRMDRFAPAYGLISCSMLSLIGWIDVCVTAAGLGAPIDPGRTSMAGLGLAFVIIGNVLGKVTPNFFVGVRTPWTLASPEVWRRTHRLAGWIFVTLGALFAATALIGASPAAPLLAVVPALLWLVLYSYLIYRRTDPEEAEL